MALNIRNEEAERLASELAKLTGETKTEAVARALRERLARLRAGRRRRRLPTNWTRSRCTARRSRSSTPALPTRSSATARTASRADGAGHPNFGDCFAYALATVRDEPLLFKGDDFQHTDVPTL